MSTGILMIDLQPQRRVNSISKSGLQLYLQKQKVEINRS